MYVFPSFSSIYSADKGRQLTYDFLVFLPNKKHKQIHIISDYQNSE